MIKAFEIYLYVCGSIISIAIVIGLIAVFLNIIVYVYQSFIGFGTFKKFLRKYHSEMYREKILKPDVSKAFKKEAD